MTSCTGPASLLGALVALALTISPVAVDVDDPGLKESKAWAKKDKKDKKAKKDKKEKKAKKSDDDGSDDEDDDGKGKAKGVGKAKGKGKDKGKGKKRGYSVVIQT